MGVPEYRHMMMLAEASSDVRWTAEHDDCRRTEIREAQRWQVSRRVRRSARVAAGRPPLECSWSSIRHPGKWERQQEGRPAVVNATGHAVVVVVSRRLGVRARGD